MTDCCTSLGSACLSGEEVLASVTDCRTSLWSACLSGEDVLASVTDSCKSLGPHCLSGVGVLAGSEILGGGAEEGLTNNLLHAVNTRMSKSSKVNYLAVLSTAESGFTGHSILG